jgi:hypothetical protein
VEVLLRALVGCAALLAWLKLSLVLALVLTPFLLLFALGPDKVESNSRLDFVLRVVKWLLYVVAHVPDLLFLLVP